MLKRNSGDVEAREAAGFLFYCPLEDITGREAPSNIIKWWSFSFV